MSAIFNIKGFLAERRKAAGKHHSKGRLEAEAELLRNDIEKYLASKIDDSAEDEFPERYQGLINVSKRRIAHHGYLDLFEAMTSNVGNLILTKPRKNDDVVWTPGKELQGWRGNVWPLPVAETNLVVPPHKRHYRMTRHDVLRWDCAAVMVPDGCVGHLVRFLKKGGGAVLAVVAADDGVCVVFRIHATDYETWQRCCRALERGLPLEGIAVSKISLQTLVPISRESRGRGALLYLA